LASTAPQYIRQAAGTRDGYSKPDEFD